MQLECYTTTEEVCDIVPQRRIGVSELLRRIWYRLRGERPLLTTFWPQDYQRGATYQIAGQVYRITRYFHAQDYRFYEVWGHPVPASVSKPARESLRARVARRLFGHR